MPVVAFPGTPGAQKPDSSSGGPSGDRSTVAGAVARFLGALPVATTRRSYARTLARLTAVTGPHHPVADLDCDHYAAVMTAWDDAAAATWNRHLSALVSFTTWAQRQDLLATNPARRLNRRKTTQHGDRAIPQARLEKLFTDDRHPLRERLLWRLLYETAARAEEISSLDVEDLDPEFRRARILSKGGAVEYVHRHRHRHRPPAAPPTPRPHGRAGVPGRPPRSHLRTPGARGRRHLPVTGRGRRSYPRAEYLFKTASAELDPHGDGWTLHQLRHSALTHLAAVGRTAPKLQAKSRHQHLASLGRYVRLGEETSARITAEHDPAARRRSR
ncbi:site-specific integrase [Streptosporangium canum]|uniref:tyrosine-type recombinase/integrase n=1 Tax=Streptosporangium canum TaxID=324952 RepID=UPI003443ED16